MPISAVCSYSAVDTTVVMQSPAFAGHYFYLFFFVRWKRSPNPNGKPVPVTNKHNAKETLSFILHISSEYRCGHIHAMDASSTTQDPPVFNKRGAMRASRTASTLRRR